MPWKHRNRLCQHCFTVFWCKDRRQFHCGRKCAQLHCKNLGPKDYKLPKVSEPKHRKTRSLLDPDYQEWFWSQVQKTPTCWLWIGHINAGGYGVARLINGDWQAYKQAWRLIRGEVPIGSGSGNRALSIRHKCRQKACVNPDHLELGTHADNMQDKVRWKRTLIGDALGWSK